MNGNTTTNNHERMAIRIKRSIKDPKRIPPFINRKLKESKEKLNNKIKITKDGIYDALLPNLILNFGGVGKKGVIVYQSTVPWHVHLFQRPHQMALEFGRQGYLFIFLTKFDEDRGYLKNGFEEVGENVYLTDQIKSVEKT